MMKYTVVAYQSSSHKELWNSFVNTARESLFFFNRDFLEYHSDRFVDASLVIFEEDNLVAIFPASVANNEVKSHGGLTYGGLIVRRNERYSNWKEMFQAVVGYYKHQNIRKITIKHIPSFYCHSSNDELLFIQKEYQSQVEYSCTSVWKKHRGVNFSKSILRYAKKAHKNGVEIKQTNDFNCFWNTLLIPKLSDKYQTKPVHTLQEMNLLRNCFPEQIRLYGAFKEGKMVAGIVFFLFQRVQKIQYIAGADSETNRLGALQLLHHHCITNCEKDYFDFGTSIEPSTQQLNDGLFQWKEHCGAELFSTFVVHIDLAE